MIAFNIKTYKIAPLLIFVAAVLWGIDGLIRTSLFSLPPLIIVFYEHLIGSLIIAPFFWTQRKKLNLNHKQWLAILWVSLMSGLLGTLWFTQALVQTDFIPFSVVFLIQKLQPIFAIAMAIVLLKEKITKRYLIWVFPALISGFLITFPDGRIDLAHPGTRTAAMYALGAAIAWGSSTAVSRYALNGQSNTIVTGLRFFITTAFASLTIVLFNLQIKVLDPRMSDIYRLVFIALSTGMVAIWLYYQGLKHTQARIATILELALPLTALVIDFVWFKTVLLPIQYIAAVLMFISIYQVSKLNSHEASS